MNKIINDNCTQNYKSLTYAYTKKQYCIKFSKKQTCLIWARDISRALVVTPLQLDSLNLYKCWCYYLCFLVVDEIYEVVEVHHIFLFLICCSQWVFHNAIRRLWSTLSIHLGVDLQSHCDLSYPFVCVACSGIPGGSPGKKYHTCMITHGHRQNKSGSFENFFWCVAKKL